MTYFCKSSVWRSATCFIWGLVLSVHQWELGLNLAVTHVLPCSKQHLYTEHTRLHAGSPNLVCAAVHCAVLSLVLDLLITILHLWYYSGSKGLESIQSIRVEGGQLICLSSLHNRLWVTAGNDVISIDPESFKIERWVRKLFGFVRAWSKIFLLRLLQSSYELVLGFLRTIVGDGLVICVVWGGLKTLWPTCIVTVIYMHYA